MFFVFIYIEYMLYVICAGGGGGGGTKIARQNHEKRKLSLLVAAVN